LGPVAVVMPFDTGYGRELDSHTLDAYTQVRSIYHATGALA